MGTIHTRAEKIRWLRDRVKSLLLYDGANYVSERELITQFCLYFASTERTAREILDMLIINRELFRYKGYIFDKGSFEAEQIMDKSAGMIIEKQTRQKRIGEHNPQLTSEEEDYLNGLLDKDPAQEKLNSHPEEEIPNEEGQVG